MAVPVLLIEDHPTFRAGFAHVLAGLAVPTVLEEAASMRAAFDCLELRHDHALVVYDWCLPDGGGVAGLLAVLQLAPQARVMVLSGVEEEAIEHCCQQLGAHAFVPKSAPVAALRATLAGLIDPAVHARTDAAAVSQWQRRIAGRRREVLRLLATGLTNKEIASHLNIAEATARDHVGALLEILGARNRAEAVATALQHGLLSGSGRAG